MVNYIIIKVSTVTDLPYPPPNCCGSNLAGEEKHQKPLTESNKLKHSLNDMETVKALNAKNDVLNKMKIRSIDSKMSVQNTHEGCFKTKHNVKQNRNQSFSLEISNRFESLKNNSDLK